MPKNSTSDIAAFVARKQKISKKEAADIVSTFFSIISEGLQSDRQVKVRGLGTFKVTAVKARESVNINNGERLIIEGHDKLTFIPDASMKELVNKPFAQFSTVIVNNGVNFDSIDAASDAEERQTEISQDAEKAEEENSEPKEYDIDQKALTTESEEESEPSNSEEEPVLSEGSDTNEDEQATPKDENQSVILSEQAKEETSIIASSSSDSISEDKAISTKEKSESDNLIREEGSNGILKDETISTEEKQKAELEESKTTEQEHENVAAKDEDDEEDSEKISREYFDEQINACRKRCNRNFVLSIVLLIVGLAAGFLIGHYLFTGINNDKNTDTKEVAQIQPTPQKEDADVKDSVTNDSVQNQNQDIEEKENPKAEEKESDNNEPNDNKVPESETETSPADQDIAKLNADRRLKFGAYEIVGIDKVVRLKKGETMRSYSNKTLGQDMVVYFQVLNGTDNLKEGDELKVPKIRLKKQYRK